MKWRQLQEENAHLRVMLNGQLQSVSEDIYDSFILREIAAQKEEFNMAVVIGKVLGKYQLGISDAWKKNWLVRAALLIMYGVPYVFLSINGDATSGTLIYYGIMILAFSLLCWVSNKTHNVPIVFVGNIISFISSWVFAAVFDLDAMSWYFKPFTAQSLLLVVSVVIFVIQAIVVSILVWKKHKNSSGV